MSVFSRFLQLQNGAPRTVDLAANTLAVLGLQLNGSSSGNLSQFAAATTSSYSVFWPSAQGAPSSFLQNDGSGNLSWGSVVSSPTISSNFIAGENFAANRSFVVRWAMDSLAEDTDEIFKADYDATNEDDFWVIGIAHSPTFRSEGQAITVYSFGSYTLGSADTPFDAADIGKPVWLTGVGTFSTIAPTGDAQADFKVGIVIGTDRIWLDGQMMGIGNSSGGGIPVFPTPIAEGGTGQNNKSDAFDALSPMSALGDLIVGGASGTGIALAIGDEGQVLTIASGIPAWVDSSSSSSLAQHHIFVGNASGVATDVAMSGEATIISTGAVTLSNAAVIAKVLTGFSSGAGSVSSSDSILSAIQKLDGNIAGKQATGNYITALTGEVTASGPGSASATLSNAAVIAKLLTGFSSGAGTVSSSDSILSAIQKLDGNTSVLNTKVNHLVTLSGVSSGSDDLGTFTGSTIPDSSTIKSAFQSLETYVEGITGAVSSVNGATGIVTVNAINQLTGDVTATAASGSQSKATSVAAIQGTAVSGTTGSGNVVFSASPTFTGTIVAAAANFSGAISASNFSGSSSGTNTGDQTITLTSEATGSGTGSFAVTLTNSAVIGKVLTGYTSGAGTVSATDTILQAIQKLNGNIVAASGSAITSLTGEVTATGPGASSATVSNAAVIAKVLTGFTAGAGTVSATDSILTALQKHDGNIAGKQATGNYITALTGDATASGPGSAALTFATVNSNVGSFGSSTSIPTFTVNAKGLITAASGNSVIAPAGTLSGTTLNATVVTSSLTSVGTITSGVWTGTTIALANGGTGQVTKAAAFDALSPMTTGGDLIYGGASGTGTRLANGSSGQVLTSNGGTSAPSWQAAGGGGTGPRSEVWVYGSTATGSTNTKIKRFTTTQKNTGTGITYADSATLGATFTINETGLYSISYADILGLQEVIGLSLNSTQLTTNITTITAADRIMATENGTSSDGSVCALVLLLTAGDVVRAHTDGHASSSNNTFATHFRITKVNT